MKTSRTHKPAEKRIIGDVSGSEDGPLVIVLGGVHGNELTGIEALKQFFFQVHEDKVKVRGRVVGLRGNMSALENKDRFIEEDLNRIWTESIIEEVRDKDKHSLRSVERKELKELLDIVDLLLNESDNYPAFIIDFHSFSAENGMFAISSSHDSHKQIVSKMDIPVVFGMETALGGTVLDYFRRKGHVALAFEGGPHNEPKTVKNKLAILYQFLEKTGNLDTSQYFADFTNYNHYLKEKNRPYPRFTELVYKYTFKHGDNFRMHPGYSNFQRVEEGQHIADDCYGSIYVRHDGYLLMPLYQNAGSDGFFIIRDK